MAHATMAVSEAAFRELFDVLKDNLAMSTSDSGSWGPFSASYSAGFRLEGGTLDLRNPPDEVRINELDVVYDPLSLSLGIDIPELCTPSFCLLWLPFVGCVINVPSYCIFSADPDITIPIDLSGLIQSEISGAFNVDTRYFNDPANSGISAHAAHLAGDPDKWQFYLDPIWLDLDLIDIADTVGNILDAAIDWAVDTLLAPLPGVIRDVFSWFLGGIVDVIRAILDIGDDIDEWLSDLFGVSFGLFDFVLTMIADYFANLYPIFEFEDPYPIMPAADGLIPVLIPIRNVDTDITNTEFVLTADVG